VKSDVKGRVEFAGRRTDWRTRGGICGEKVIGDQSQHGGLCLNTLSTLSSYEADGEVLRQDRKGLADGVLVGRGFA
jgi:hypothetical protein